MPDAEILEGLRAELLDGIETLSETLTVLRVADGDSAAYTEASHTYAGHLKNVSMAAEWGGLTGLPEAVAVIDRNLRELHLQETGKKTAICDRLEKWPALFLTYLQSPENLHCAKEIIAYLTSSQWISPLDAEGADQLVVLFAPAQTDGDQNTTPAAPVDLDTEPVNRTNDPQPEQIREPRYASAVSGAATASPAGAGDMSGTVDGGADDDEAVANAPDCQAAETTAQEKGLLQALRAEIVDLQDDLSKWVGVLASTDADDESLAEAVEQYTAMVERLWSTCESVGLAGLQDICMFINNNLLELAVQDRSARQAVRELLEAWPGFILGYLEDPSNVASCRALIRHVQDRQWASPLADDEARVLLRRLTEGPSVSEEMLEVEARPTQAQPEDVSLEVPEDNQELLDAFLQEAPMHAADFSACTQKIFENTANKADIRLAQRIAHTLKGSAHLTGIRGVAALAHHIEDILEFINTDDMRPPQALAEVLVESADCLEAMVDAVMGHDSPPANAPAVLQQVLDWANRIDSGDFGSKNDITSIGDADKNALPSEPEAVDEDEIKRASAEHSSAATQQVLRVPTKTIDELLRLVGEFSMSVNQLQDRYGRTAQHVKALREQDEFVHRKTFELEHLVDVHGVSVTRHEWQRTGTTDEAFDPLEMNRYNELHSTTQGVIEAVNDSRELGIGIQEDLAALEELFVQHDRLNKMLQHAVMSTRMVPVRNIVPRLQRTVRQTCRATKKHARLELTGEDSLIDGEVLQRLADPLMHILRNAIDHGIEPPQERIDKGKPETGLISLHFAREGNTIVVRCEDDGRGLDYRKIRETAVERGLIQPDAQLAHHELARLVYTPGFSTNPMATHTSGRGIGLDVVYAAVIDMKGSAKIVSKESGGCEIILRLPVSLVTAHVLLVRVQSELFAVPATSLEQILASGTGAFEDNDDGRRLRVGDEVYPVKPLAEMLGLGRLPEDNDDAKPLLLIRADAGPTAVIVDQVVDGRDLVIKNMGQYVKGVAGVLGASILGDGTVVPILDLPEMLRIPVTAAAAHVVAAETTAAAAVPRVLIVDDSLSARKALSQLVQDAGFESLLAKDGLEAVEIMRRVRPDILFVDLEMPRMNGLELTYHVRANDETKEVPVVVITSRSTEKHRQQAKLAGASAYVTKPFQENELLDLIETAIGGA